MTSVSYRDFTGSAAENYQRHFVPTIALPVSGDLIRAAALEPGQKVLDVACGTGVVARLAAERVGEGGEVTGVDIATDMIEAARSVRSTGAPIEWQIGDAAALPFPDECFDVALCQMGLMFMDGPAAAIAEMRRVLAPGGRLVINTPGAIQRPFELMERAIVEHIDPELGGFVRSVFSMHDPEALGLLLREAGLVEVSARVTTTKLRLPPPEEFVWQYISLTPMAAIVDGAPEAARNAMERQVVETWQPLLVDGVAAFDQPMVLAKGRK